MLLTNVHVKKLYLEYLYTYEQVGDLCLPCISTNCTNKMDDVIVFMVLQYDGDIWVITQILCCWLG